MYRYRYFERYIFSYIKIVSLEIFLINGYIDKYMKVKIILRIVAHKVILFVDR